MKLVESHPMFYRKEIMFAFLWFLFVGNALAQEVGLGELLDKARRLRAEGTYPEAIAAYESFLAQDPKNTDILLELAQTHAWSRNDREALELYDKIQAQHPEHSDAILGKAVLQSWRKEYKESEALFRKVVELSPDYLDAYLGLGRMLGWQGRYAEALSIVEQGLKHQPENEKALRVLGQLQLWADHPDRAIPIYQRLSERYASDVYYILALARAQAAAGQMKEAIDSFERAKSIAPDRQDIHAELGQLYAKSLRLDDAITELEKVIAVRSSNIDDYVTLGRVYAYKNRIEDSKRLYRDALKNDPKNLDALNGLARVQGYAREWENSRETFLKALQLDPLNIEAKEGLERLRRLKAPELVLRFNYLRVRDRDPKEPPSTESRLLGPDVEFTYKMHPDTALWLRLGRFVVRDSNLDTGVTDIRADRSEFGIGGVVHWSGGFEFRSRLDFILFSDRGGARLSRDAGINKAGGFAILQYERGKHVASAIFSREVFLLEADQGSHWNPAATQGYSFSDDIDWSGELSTLFQVGQDFFPYISTTRFDTLSRIRYRPQKVPSFLFEAQVRYRDNPVAWNQTGFIKWKGQVHQPELSLELGYSVDRDSFAETVGHEWSGLISWEIFKGINVYQQISFRRDYGFAGSFFNASTYVGYRF